MFIKKGIMFATTLFASTIVLTACGNSDDSASNANEGTTEETSSAELQDGTYSLEEENFDENGWRVLFDLTVNDGKITKSNYDYEDADGNLKSENEEYQKNMSEKVGVGPADYIPQLNGELEEKQDPSEVDAVSGATHSSESFIKYAKQLVDAAKEGNTDTIEVSN
ncbi:FMN-binding protein [Marinilactibacillus sp. GCM10026970]|uniref:FMN-binding protein n=1 Tax=Marinilactibacillus sp. GCM10026970 TaxID=3252642 RepID=UPI00361A58F4